MIGRLLVERSSWAALGPIFRVLGGLGAVLGHLGAFFKLFFGLLDLIFAIFSFLGPFSAVL